MYIVSLFNCNIMNIIYQNNIGIIENVFQIPTFIGEILQKWNFNGSLCITKWYFHLT